MSAFSASAFAFFGVVLCGYATDNSGFAGMREEVPGVTIPLDEFKQLYRDARLNTDRKALEEEKRELVEEFDRKKTNLENERMRLHEQEAARQRLQEKNDQEKKQREVALGLRLVGLNDGVDTTRANWVLLNHSARGKYSSSAGISNGDGTAAGNIAATGEEPGMAVFDLVLHVHIFEDLWTAIPLIDAQAIAMGWEISRQKMYSSSTVDTVARNRNNTVNNGSADDPSTVKASCTGNGSVRHESLEGGWQPVEFGPELLLTLRERAEKPGSSSLSSSSKTGSDGREARDDNDVWQDYTLVTNQAGSYQIRFRIFCRVQNNRNLLGLVLNLAYPLSTMSLRLENNNGESKSASVKQLSVEPAAATELVENADHTMLNLQMPATKKLAIQWRMESKKITKQKGPTDVTKRDEVSESASRDEVSESASSDDSSSDLSQSTVVQHDVLHSIGDSVIVSENNLKFTLDDSERSLSSVVILVPPGVRITGVVAHGMQTWRTETVTNSTGTTASPTAPNGTGTGGVQQNPNEGQRSGATAIGVLVHVFFKSSAILKEVIVMLTTEMEFSEFGQDGANLAVELPFVVCQNVLRQIGTLAVVKAASVEVHEQSSTGVARASVGDVPAHVLSKTNRPVVLAYRFLSARQSIVLSLLHHEEIATLESVVDKALYQVLVLETQQMHSLVLVLQNTQRQYMAVKDVPKASQVWSLRVNSLATQPVRGGKRHSGAKGAEDPADLLMVPLLVGPRPDDDGFGLKTSVELSWMTQHEPLGKNGTVVLSPPRLDMPISALSVEVQLPEHLVANFTGSLMNVTTFSGSMPHAVNYETDQHVTRKGHKFATGDLAGHKENSKTSLKAKIPKGGTRYRFEKILVIGDGAALSASYEEKNNNEKRAGIFSRWF
jgi:hypothetical protein